MRQSFVVVFVGFDYIQSQCWPVRHKQHTVKRETHTHKLRMWRRVSVRRQLATPTSTQLNRYTEHITLTHTQAVVRYTSFSLSKIVVCSHSPSIRHIYNISMRRMLLYHCSHRRVCWSLYPYSFMPLCLVSNYLIFGASVLVSTQPLRTFAAVHWTLAYFTAFHPWAFGTKCTLKRF